jgi:hypothetical protein
MTLVELLVAFMVLLMLVGALVSLTTQSLETWTSGETRKDMYDRGQVVLDAIAQDIRSAYTENELFTDGYKDLQPPTFAADLDRNHQPRLRLVRTGNPYVLGIDAGAPQPRRVVAPMYYTQAWEVAYVMDPDPTKATLWRGLRAFDRRTDGTLLRNADEVVSSDLFTRYFRPVESGILFVGYKFWTQYTTTWDETVQIRHARPGSRGLSGPETRWDSTRHEDSKFYFHKRRFDRTNPDFVYPEIVEISVQVQSGGAQNAAVRLSEPADLRVTVLRLTNTQGMPDGPSMVKIDAEWMEYGGKTLSELVDVRRGRRGTAPAAHSPQAVVRFGETFTTEVRLPAFREAQDP